MDYIKLGEVEYPVNLGIAGLREAEREMKKSITQLLSELINSSIEDTVFLCFLGLKHGARKAGNPFVLTVDDVSDLLDEPGKIAELSNLVGEQLGKIFAPMIELPEAEK